MFFADFEHVNGGLTLYCLEQSLSLHYRVGSTSPVTFKMKLYVSTVNNNSFHPLAPSKMLHRVGKYENLVKPTPLDALKKFPDILILNGLNGVDMNSLT